MSLDSGGEELFGRVRAICLALPEATWGFVGDLMERAYRMTAPKRLIAQLDA